MKRSTWDQRARSILKADRPWFIFYGMPIIGLVGWIVWAERRNFREELRPYLSRVLKNSAVVISNIDQDKLVEITRDIRDYASPINLEIDSVARASLAHLEGFHSWCDDSTSNECAEPYRLTQLVDSLFTVMQGHNAFHFDFPVIGQDQTSLAKWSPEFWSRFKPDDQKLLASTLKLEASLEVGRFLDSCRTKVESKELVFDRLFPVLSRSKSAVRAGERFDGEISLRLYTATADSMQIWVNGKSVPVKDGIAHFSRGYSRPGTYRLDTKIAVSNVRYGVMNVYERSFELEVLPPLYPSNSGP